MDLHPNFTNNGPYVVMSEDTWDYYKDPPIRDKLFESDNYFEAVSYASERSNFRSLKPYFLFISSL